MKVSEAFGQDLLWLASRAQLTVNGGLRAIKAEQDGRIVAMVGFDGWTNNACALHVAVDYPAALRHILRPAFRIAFGQLGKQVVTAGVLSTNERSLNLVRHLGFTESGRIQNWWMPGVDLHLFSMQRGECRWLEDENGCRHGRQGGSGSPRVQSGC